MTNFEPNTKTITGNVYLYICLEQTLLRGLIQTLQNRQVYLVSQEKQQRLIQIDLRGNWRPN
jgi:hypothetical protein